MGLLRKVGVLLGALVHKPFMPRPERVDLEERPGGTQPVEERQERPELAEPEPQVEDTERVADLIARQQRGEEA